VTDTPTYLWVVFGVLFGSTLVWFALVSTLYRRLESKHQDKYRQMGEPGLISNNPPSATITLMKFIFTREDRALNDPLVSRLTAFMMVFFLCYLVVLVFGMIKVLSMTPHARGP
jgi:hypothetical protein